MQINGLARLAGVYWSERVCNLLAVKKKTELSAVSIVFHP